IWIRTRTEVESRIFLLKPVMLIRNGFLFNRHLGKDKKLNPDLNPRRPKLLDKNENKTVPY
ncbi:MAG: hypothetical protein ACK559_40940, partial [bacterium]